MKFYVLTLLIFFSFQGIAQESLKSRISKTAAFHEKVVQLYLAYGRELQHADKHYLQSELERIKPIVQSQLKTAIDCDLKPANCDQANAHRLVTYTGEIINDYYQKLLFELNALELKKKDNFEALDSLLDSNPLRAACRVVRQKSEEAYDYLSETALAISRALVSSDYKALREDAAKLFEDVIYQKGSAYTQGTDKQLSGTLPKTRDLCTIYNQLIARLDPSRRNALSNTDMFRLMAEAQQAMLPPGERYTLKQFDEMIGDWETVRAEYSDPGVKSQPQAIKLNNVTNGLINSYLFQYVSDQVGADKMLAGEGGNCQIATSMIASAMQSAAPNASADEELVVQQFEDHIQIVLWNKKEDTIYNPMSGAKLSRKEGKGRAPIFHLGVVEKMFADKLSYHVPKSCKKTAKQLQMMDYLAAPLLPGISVSERPEIGKLLEPKSLLLTTLAVNIKYSEGPLPERSIQSPSPLPSVTTRAEDRAPSELQKPAFDMKMCVEFQKNSLDGREDTTSYAQYMCTLCARFGDCELTRESFSYDSEYVSLSYLQMIENGKFKGERKVYSAMLESIFSAEMISEKDFSKYTPKEQRKLRTLKAEYEKLSKMNEYQCLEKMKETFHRSIAPVSYAVKVAEYCFKDRKKMQEVLAEVFDSTELNSQGLSGFVTPYYEEIERDRARGVASKGVRLEIRPSATSESKRVPDGFKELNPLIYVNSRAHQAMSAEKQHKLWTQIRKQHFPQGLCRLDAFVHGYCHKSIEKLERPLWNLMSEAEKGVCAKVACE